MAPPLVVPRFLRVSPVRDGHQPPSPRVDIHGLVTAVLSARLGAARRGGFCGGLPLLLGGEEPGLRLELPAPALRTLVFWGHLTGTYIFKSS